MNPDIIAFLSGTVAGGVSRTLTAPIDRLKISRQTSLMYSKKTIIENVLHVYRTEQVKGFFRGNGINIIRMIPHSGCTFLGYSFIPRLCNTENTAVIGGLSGAFATSVTYPLKTVRTLLICHNIDFKGVMKTYTIPALYRGYPVALISTIPYNSIMYFTYSYCRSKEYGSTVSGFVGASVAVGICYPMDLYCRQIQVSNQSYSCIFNALWSRGPKSFYAGMLLSLLRIAPGNAISFTVAEKMKSIIS
jgi:solute carrier family 25 (mitochondrial phosphate transporter), member 23/24/25/41